MRILLLAAFISGISLGAEAEDPPDYLKGATYTVNLSNGKKFETTAREFKLVPRVKHEKAKSPMAKIQTKVIEKTVRKLVYNKYQIALLAGSGPSRLRLRDGEDEAQVESYKDLVIGLAVGLNIDKDWGFQGLILTNETVMVGVNFNLGFR